MKQDRYTTDAAGLVDLDILRGWADKGAHHMSVADDMAERWDICKHALKEEPQYQAANKAERRKLISINWGMNDAAASYNWHINAANRFHQAIIAQHALRQIAKESQ